LFEQRKHPSGDPEILALGEVELRIVYDDDVYGARIVATRPSKVRHSDLKHERLTRIHFFISRMRTAKTSFVII